MTLPDWNRPDLPQDLWAVALAFLFCAAVLLGAYLVLRLMVYERPLAGFQSL